MDKSLQLQVIQNMILYIVGPKEILLANRYIGDYNIFDRPEINSEESLSGLLRNHLLTQNENISLAEVYADLVIVLRNGPVIKT